MEPARGGARDVVVALAQMDVRLGDTRHNIARAIEAVGRAAARGAELVLLPELWSTGYELERAEAHARHNRAVVLPAIADTAREHGVYVLGSLLLSNASGGVQNTAVLFGPHGGALAEYAKIHLFGLMAEDRHLVAGDDAPTVALPGFTAAIAICYDLRFPELFRAYALAGATVIMIPAEWPAVRLEHWRTLVRARAIENQCFVVACNRSGTSAGTEFGGHSLVVDPWGRILAEGDASESLLLATLTLAHVDEARAQMNILADRRPALYAAHPQLATAP